MSRITAEDIASAARRAGWPLAPERAAEIAATAAPRIAAFDRARESLAFDDDTGFANVLHETRYREGEAE